MEKHAELFDGRAYAARIGLFHPGEKMFWQWDQLSPLFFGTRQTLLAAGIPWRVVTPHENFTGLDVLLTFDEPLSTSGVKNVHVPDLAGWIPQPISFWNRHPDAHALASKAVSRLYRAYFGNRLFRTAGDKFGITRLYMASPLFNLPNFEDRQSLLAALPKHPFPVAKTDTPVLVEFWHRGDEYQLHLVNYALEPVRILVNFGKASSGTVLSPDQEEINFEGAQLEIIVDIYSIFVWHP